MLAVSLSPQLVVKVKLQTLYYKLININYKIKLSHSVLPYLKPVLILEACSCIIINEFFKKA